MTYVSSDLVFPGELSGILITVQAAAVCEAII